MNILFIAGYPHPNNPHRNVFNQRAVKAISLYAKVTVVTHRVWKPGRKFIERKQDENTQIYYLCLPQYPSNHPIWFELSMRVVNSLTWKMLKTTISGADLIHSVGASYAGVIGAYLKCKTGKPHVMQLIGSDVNSDIPQLLSLQRIRSLHRTIDLLTANSAELVKQFNRLYPANKLSYRVIYRGVDTEKFKPAKLNGKSKLQMLFLGGMPRYSDLLFKENTKGGVTLMEAWQIIDRQLSGEEVELVFAGPDSDGEKVKKWKDSLKNPGNITMAGLLTPEQVLAKYIETDVVLVPSMEEGLPNVAVEAGACGKMVIGSTVGGIPEVVETGKTGILVKPGDKGELAKALLSVIKKPVLAEEYGRKARERIAGEFNHRSFAPAYLEVYRKLMGKLN